MQCCHQYIKRHFKFEQNQKDNKPQFDSSMYHYARDTHIHTHTLFARKTPTYRISTEFHLKELQCNLRGETTSAVIEMQK